MKTQEAVARFLFSRHAKGLESTTIRWYRGILYSFQYKFKKLPKGPEPIEEFINSLNLADERRHGYYRAIRAMYHWLNTRKLFPNDTFDLIESPKRSPKRRAILMPDQLDQLLAYPHTPIIKACLMFLVDTGCRPSDMTSINSGSFMETPWGCIVKVRGKTGERFLPISGEVYSAIIHYIPLPFTPYRLRIKIARAFKDAHIRGSSITLRHSFGSLWEGDELVLQRIMGHTSLETTKIYRQLRVRILAEQHRQYSPLKMVFSWSKSML